MSLESDLRACAAAAGLVGIGMCDAGPFDEVAASLQAARDSGRSAGLGFTFSEPAVSSDPARSYPWARSLIGVAHAYLPEAGAPGTGRTGTGRVARFATEDHYRGLRAGLGSIAAVLTGAGYRAEILCDDNRLVDRAVAVRSGVGWWGKSSMVLVPGSGPWVLLGTVVTDAVVQPDEPMKRDCGTCDACIPACPTGAIIAPGVLDARRCLAAIAQSGGAIPLEFRESMGDRVYGCDECLDACPPGGRLATGAIGERGRIDLVELLASADRPLRRRWAHFYVPSNRTRYLRRNAIVALGNAGDGSHLAVLCGLLGHPDPLLRSHAAWALGRIGGPVARAALESARGAERDEAVLTEVAAAIGTLG